MDNGWLLQTVRKIYVNEGLAGFYKGLAAPLASIPALNSIIFASFEISKALLQRYHIKEDLSLWDMGIAGAMAGLFGTIILTPIELIKCKMQLQKKFRKYKHSIDCFYKLVMKNGVAGIYQGNVINIIREISGNGAQFYTYEFAKRYFFGRYSIFEIPPWSSEVPTRERLIKMKQAENSSLYLDSDLSAWKAMACGGFAGLNAWAASYAADTIKTRIQCENYKFYKSWMFDGGICEVAKTIYAHSGIRGFFKGFNAILGRAIIGNAFGFWGWETSRKIFRVGGEPDEPERIH
jgi:Mitochondrial carrier protein